jgi:hypothetical protein
VGDNVEKRFETGIYVHEYIQEPSNMEKNRKYVFSTNIMLLAYCNIVQSYIRHTEKARHVLSRRGYSRIPADSHFLVCWYSLREL